MAKKKILTENGQEILPITHESCVLDNNGVSIGSKIGNINELATDSRTDLVSAINDILYYKNNIKQENENLIQEKEELLQEQEETRSKLAELMKDNGHDIIGDEDIDTLLNLIKINGIDVCDIKQISGGQNFTMVLKTDGSLWGCGNNSYGQLGLDGTSPTGIFKQVTTNVNNDVKYVACGLNFTYIVKNDGSLWACGYNYNGQLGLGTSGSYSAITTFTQVTTNINNDVKQVACGNNHAMILKTDGSVWGTGSNGYGPLGSGGGSGSQYTTFTQAKTNINNDVKQIACSSLTSYVLKNDGSLWSCGFNECGQLGLGSSDTNAHGTFTKVTTNINNDVKQVACGGQKVFIVKNDGSLWACGHYGSGQLGLGNLTGNILTFTKVTTNINNDVKEVACGTDHTFILKNDGTVWSCGYNGYGGLGLGDESARLTFTKVPSTSANSIIACGNRNTFVLKADGSLWACGENTNGQLGTNDGNHHLAFTRLNLPGTNLTF